MPFLSSTSSALTFLGLTFLAASSVSAQSTTTLFLPGFDQQPIQVAVVGSDATATTLLISNSPGADEGGIPGTITITEGPSTFAYSYTEVGAITFAAQCNLDGASATCTESAGGSEANFPGVSTNTYDIASSQVTATVIAGAAGAGTTSAPGGSSTTTSGSGSHGSSTPSRSGSSSSAGASSTSKPSNGATERGITNAAIVFGLAVAGVLAALT